MSRSREHAPRERIEAFVRRSPSAALLSLVAVLAILVAVFAPQIAPYDPLAHDLPNRLQPPSSEHPMGTDNFGRDVLSRVIFGARASIALGLLSVAAVFVLGVGLGVASALIGGRIDLFGQRFMDTMLAFPALVLALALTAAFGPSIYVVASAVVIALTPQMARLARSLTLELKAADYVMASRSLGAVGLHIALRHVLPNGVGPLLALFSGFVGEAMVLESVMSYLGLGVPPPTPSWGRMISEGSRFYLESAPWLTIFPGLCVTLMVFCFALLGDALRDAWDPRHAGRSLRRK